MKVIRIASDEKQFRIINGNFSDLWNKRRKTNQAIDETEKAFHLLRGLAKRKTRKKSA